MEGVTHDMLIDDMSTIPVDDMSTIPGSPKTDQADHEMAMAAAPHASIAIVTTASNRRSPSPGASPDSCPEFVIDLDRRRSGAAFASIWLNSDEPVGDTTDATHSSPFHSARRLDIRPRRPSGL
jgi:hypothetical protein